MKRHGRFKGEAMTLTDAVMLFIICEAVFPVMLYAALKDESKLKGLFVGLACLVNAFAAYCLVSVIAA